MARSVVVLTADPVTGDRDLVTVNAARSSLVALRAGDVTPDLIHVRRSDRAIDWRRVATTRGPVLTDAQIDAAVKLALAAEQVHGGAVEVELTVAGRELRVERTRAMGEGSDHAGERTGTGR
ncbi:MAG: hypothetical protein KGK34_11600 [Chloroflexota bacterium]|nr:hypothetical protein [Chloroflexota bacterium]